MLRPLRSLLSVFWIYCILNTTAYENNYTQALPLQGNIFAQPKACPSTLTIEKDIAELQENSSKKIKEALEDKEFQYTVLELKAKLPETVAHIPKAAPGELYIFVSFSLGENALLNLAYEAKRLGATLVLRGFHKGSYLLTAKKLHKIIQETKQGIIIDPELFSLFSIASVPTFVLTRPFRLHGEDTSLTPMHDHLQGHVSTQYALKTFAKEGDLKAEAKTILSRAHLVEGEQ